ncbi:MAG: helix-turn-helix domain-containing protein, partial [Cyanobacteria bacterium J06555_3]
IDNPRTVDTHVLSLRKKIETNPRQPHVIQTVRNVGYRFNPELIETETEIPQAAKLPVTSPQQQVSRLSHGI